MTVASWRRTCCQKRLTLKRSIRITVAPAITLDSTALIWQLAWKNGSPPRLRSAGVSCIARATRSAACSTLPCVSTTAFGFDVVPEVNSICTSSRRSSGSRSNAPSVAASSSQASAPGGSAPAGGATTTSRRTSGQCGSTASITGRCSASVTTMAASQCPMTNSVSSAESEVIVGTPTAPIFAQANHVSSISGEFGRRRATLSPLPTPLSCRPRATRSTAASNSANVNCVRRRSSPSNTHPILSGASCARCSSRSRSVRRPITSIRDPRRRARPRRPLPRGHRRCGGAPARDRWPAAAAPSCGSGAPRRARGTRA